MLDETYKKLNTIYIFIFAVSVAVFVVFYFFGNTLPSATLSKDEDMFLQMFCIFWLLASVPFALWFFAQRVRKLAEQQQDETAKLKAYFGLAIVRMANVAGPLMLSMVAYFLTKNDSMIFCAGVAALALAFCKPNKWKIAEELQLPVA